MNWKFFNWLTLSINIIIAIFSITGTIHYGFGIGDGIYSIGILLIIGLQIRFIISYLDNKNNHSIWFKSLSLIFSLLQIYYLYIIFFGQGPE